MKKSIGVTVAVLVVGYVAFSWDYHLSNYMFKKVCGPEGEIGSYIYEKVALDDKYFAPIPPGEELRNMDQRFLYGDNITIDRDVFDRDYSFKTYKYIPYSSLGRISLSQTSVVRKSDGKLLGKAVSASNGRGWFNQFGALDGTPGVRCPTGRDENGYSYYRMDHKKLIKRIFSPKK